MVLKMISVSFCKKLFFSIAIIFILFTSNIVIAEQYGDMYMIGGLTSYPDGKPIEGITLTNETVDITIKEKHEYSNDTNYIFMNTGSDKKCQMCISLVSTVQGGEIATPKNIQFTVNGKIVPYKVTKSVNDRDYWKVDYWYYIDVEFISEATTEITTSYSSYLLTGVRGMIIRCAINGSYPDWSDNATYTVYLEHDMEDYYWISNIAFVDRVDNTKSCDLNKDLQKLDKLETDGYTIHKLGDGRWRIECNSSLMKRYSDEFYIKLLGTYEPDPFFTSYPGSSVDKGVSLEFLYNDQKNLSNRKLGPYELIFLTNTQLKIMRNAFYARYGYIFKDVYLNKFFHVECDNIKYKENPNFKESMLNDVERFNVATIKKLEALGKSEATKGN